MSTYYIEFIDDYGNEANVTVKAPNEELARRAIGPRTIERVVEITGDYSRSPFEWLDDPALDGMPSRHEEVS